ncbi:MAG TPA: DUF1579 family protein [Cytophagales bacterium]|nr:DUF1579 family protein [Cytophagales bacterium]
MDHAAKAYHQLNRFVGQWRTRGLVAASDNQPEQDLLGTDTYGWLPGGYFLKHTVDVTLGQCRNQTLEIIGYDAIVGDYTMQLRQPRCLRVYEGCIAPWNVEVCRRYAKIHWWI